MGGGSTFQGGRTLGEDMGLSRADGGVPSAYPVVSGAMEYQQTTTAAGVEMGRNGPFGSAGQLHGHAYSPMQNRPTIVPPSSPFHFSAGFFESPGFGGSGRGAAPTPAHVGGGYEGVGLVGSGGMDTDLQTLMNDALYGMWSNDLWGFEGECLQGSEGIS